MSPIAPFKQPRVHVFVCLLCFVFDFLLFLAQVFAKECLSEVEVDEEAEEEAVEDLAEVEEAEEAGMEEAEEAVEDTEEAEEVEDSEAAEEVDSTGSKTTVLQNMSWVRWSNQRCLYVVFWGPVPGSTRSTAH